MEAPGAHIPGAGAGAGANAAPAAVDIAAEAEAEVDAGAGLALTASHADEPLSVPNKPPLRRRRSSSVTVDHIRDAAFWQGRAQMHAAFLSIPAMLGALITIFSVHGAMSLVSGTAGDGALDAFNIQSGALKVCRGVSQNSTWHESYRGVDIVSPIMLCTLVLQVFRSVSRPIISDRPNHTAYYYTLINVTCWGVYMFVTFSDPAGSFSIAPVFVFLYAVNWLSYLVISFFLRSGFNLRHTAFYMFSHGGLQFGLVSLSIWYVAGSTVYLTPVAELLISALLAPAIHILLSRVMLRLYMRTIKRPVTHGEERRAVRYLGALFLAMEITTGIPKWFVLISIENYPRFAASVISSCVMDVVALHIYYNHYMDRHALRTGPANYKTRQSVILARWSTSSRKTVVVPMSEARVSSVAAVVSSAAAAAAFSRASAYEKHMLSILAEKVVMEEVGARVASAVAGIVYGVFSINGLDWKDSRVADQISHISTRLLLAVFVGSTAEMLKYGVCRIGGLPAHGVPWTKGWRLVLIVACTGVFGSTSIVLGIGLMCNI